ncbi:hypothetical protein DFJ73DRAFT_200166 [Zopfochytrium polystomum]|nr:hypothetical protein DFJ73DRAFT_200166 [Zopfochytrium polystomum]
MLGNSLRGGAEPPNGQEPRPPSSSAPVKETLALVTSGSDGGLPVDLSTCIKVHFLAQKRILNIAAFTNGTDVRSAIFSVFGVDAKEHTHLGLFGLRGGEVDTETALTDAALWRVCTSADAVQRSHLVMSQIDGGAEEMMQLMQLASSSTGHNSKPHRRKPSDLSVIIPTAPSLPKETSNISSEPSLISAGLFTEEPPAINTLSRSKTTPGRVGVGKFRPPSEVIYENLERFFPALKDGVNLVGGLGRDSNYIKATGLLRRRTTIESKSSHSQTTQQSDDSSVKEQWREKVAVLGSGGLFVSAEDPGWTEDQRKEARRRSLRVWTGQPIKSPIEGLGAYTLRGANDVGLSELSPLPEEDESPRSRTLSQHLDDEAARAAEGDSRPQSGLLDGGVTPTDSADSARLKANELQNSCTSPPMERSLTWHGFYLKPISALSQLRFSSQRLTEGFGRKSSKLKRLEASASSATGVLHERGKKT